MVPPLAKYERLVSSSSDEESDRFPFSNVNIYLLLKSVLSGAPL